MKNPTPYTYTMQNYTFLVSIAIDHHKLAPFCITIYRNSIIQSRKFLPLEQSPIIVDFSSPFNLPSGQSRQECFIGSPVRSDGVKMLEAVSPAIDHAPPVLLLLDVTSYHCYFVKIIDLLGFLPAGNKLYIFLEKLRQNA